jgi:oligopeptide transport system ATP-binding protein
VSKPLVQVRGLKVHFPVTTGLLWTRRTDLVRAVDGIDLEIQPGETLGLVGESGCGKSTTGRAILQLVRPTEGTVRFEDRELTELTPAALRPLRQRMQIIFQDPYASLNPRMTVGDIVGEPLRTHGLVSGRKEADAQVQGLMAEVGLDPKFIRRYPHEFSGGQRQRIGVARALATAPAFIVCDEPISALDVSIQAQVMNLLARLQREHGLAYLFIAHDLAAVRHVSDRIAVMYLGKLVEVGPAKDVTDSPQHPYTEALISAIPIPDPAVEAQRRRVKLQGDVPSPLNPPSGCSFHPRCPYAFDRCAVDEPALDARPDGRLVACHLDELPG